MSQKGIVRLVAAVMFALGALGSSLAQMPNPYGLPISLENARKEAAPGLAEAAKKNWNVAVAIVDPGGNLVYYENRDNTQLGSGNVGIDEAPPRPLIKRPPTAS